MEKNEKVPSEKEMLSAFSKMIGIKSVSPEIGGTGESKRADFLERLLKSWGMKVKRYDYTDRWKTKRSNLIVKFGDRKRTLWILAHTDTVSEGDRSLWKTDPFKAVVKNGKIYGRGTNDDGCGIIPGLFALKSLINEKAKLKYNFGLALVADEENGSKYGLIPLMKEGIFKRGDLFVVPDYGNPSGTNIEVAEKSLLWLKFTVIGKQIHASTPELGLNAFKEAAEFALKADRFLHSKYNKKTKMMPEGSTFEMTKHEKNVDSINILPGKEVFYMDCRIIPEYNISAILKDLKKLASKQKANITLEVVHREDAAPATGEKSEIVMLLSRAIKGEMGVNPKPMAIGGGTVARTLREKGFEAAVWAITDEVAHQANEYERVDALVDMTRVFRRLYL